jgi:hypothetical protein
LTLATNATAYPIVADGVFATAAVDQHGASWIIWAVNERQHHEWALLVVDYQQHRPANAVTWNDLYAQMLGAAEALHANRFPPFVIALPSLAPLIEQDTEVPVDTQMIEPRELALTHARGAYDRGAVQLSEPARRRSRTIPVPVIHLTSKEGENALVDAWLLAIRRAFIGTADVLRYQRRTKPPAPAPRQSRR